MPAKTTGEGFGQSWLDDLLLVVRFWRCRKRAVDWRQPTPDERAAIEEHPIIVRFGDDTVALAEVDEQRWIIRERTFWGWPDPPRFVFFVMVDDHIWAAADFNVWPRTCRHSGP